MILHFSLSETHWTIPKNLTTEICSAQLPPRSIFSGIGVTTGSTNVPNKQFRRQVENLIAKEKLLQMVKISPSILITGSIYTENSPIDSFYQPNIRPTI